MFTTVLISVKCVCLLYMLNISIHQHCTAVFAVCSIAKQVREVMHKAFWDSLEAKLAEDPPDFSHALVLIEEVKEVNLPIISQKRDSSTCLVNFYISIIVVVANTEHLQEYKRLCRLWKNMTQLGCLMVY